MQRFENLQKVNSNWIISEGRPMKATLEKPSK